MSRTASLGLSATALAAVYIVSLAILSSAWFATAPALMGAGVTIDLTLTATAAVYLLAVRPGHVRPAFLFSVFAVGLLVARLAMPASGRAVLTIVGAAWGAVEIGIAAVVLTRLRRLIRLYRMRRAEGLGLITALESSLTDILGRPRMASALAVEIGALAYGLGGWFRRTPAEGFRMRRSWSVVAVAIAMLLVPEGIGLHVLIAHWSPLAAWLATATSIYALVWVAGDAHAIRLHPIRFSGTTVIIEVGLRWRLSFPARLIAEVARIDTSPSRGEDFLRAHLLFPDLQISFSEPVTARGPLGSVRNVSKITISADRVDDLRTQLLSLREVDRYLYPPRR